MRAAEPIRQHCDKLCALPLIVVSVTTRPGAQLHASESANKGNPDVRILRSILAVLALLAAAPLLAMPPARAADTDGLFVNMTTDQPHRATMALVFSKNQLERKHPVTVFLNDRGVLIASKTRVKAFKAQQDHLRALLQAGATVLVCPMCMKHYGVKETDLLDGLKPSNPDLVGQALFRDGTRTLTW